MNTTPTGDNRRTEYCETVKIVEMWNILMIMWNKIAWKPNRNSRYDLQCKLTSINKLGQLISGFHRALLQ